MNKQKEIEQIAKILDGAECVEDALFVDFDGMAKALVNAGYGDVKQALEDYATKLHNNIVVYLKRDFDTREEVCKIIDETLKEVCGE